MLAEKKESLAHLRLDLDLESIRLGMVQALSQKNEEIEYMIEDRLKHLLTKENLQKEINKIVDPIVEDTINAAVKDHFKWGSGGKRLIDDLVKEQMYTLFPESRPKWKFHDEDVITIVRNGEPFKVQHKSKFIGPRIPQGAVAHDGYGFVQYKEYQWVEWDGDYNEG